MQAPCPSSIIMNELVHIQSTQLAIADSTGRFQPVVEIALTVAEPVFRTDHGNQITQQRHFRTSRFTIHPHQLRELAENLLKAALSAEAGFTKAIEDACANHSP